MLRLPLRSLPAFATFAAAATAALGIACGDASTTSAQDWQNQSPESAGKATTTTGTASSGDDAGAAPVTTTDTADAATGGDAEAADDGGAADSATTNTDSLTLTSSMATSSVDLMSTQTIPVTLTPSAGYSGTAMLAATGLPSDVTGTWDKTMVTFTGGAPATANLTLTTLSSTVQQLNNYTITATPMSGGTAATLAAKVTVNSKITLHLPVNLEATIATSKLNGGNPLMITAPATLSATNPISVVFHNDDATDYFEIHVNGSGTDGFAHGVAAIAPGTDETFGTSKPRVINAKATVAFYMHGYGTTASLGMGGATNDYPGTITVQ